MPDGDSEAASLQGSRRCTSCDGQARRAGLVHAQLASLNVLGSRADAAVAPRSQKAAQPGSLRRAQDVSSSVQGALSVAGCPIPLYRLPPQRMVVLAGMVREGSRSHIRAPCTEDRHRLGALRHQQEHWEGARVPGQVSSESEASRVSEPPLGRQGRAGWSSRLEERVHGAHQ